MSGLGWKRKSVLLKEEVSLYALFFQYKSPIYSSIFSSFSLSRKLTRYPLQPPNSLKSSLRWNSHTHTGQLPDIENSFAGKLHDEELLSWSYSFMEDMPKATLRSHERGEITKRGEEEDWIQ